MVNKARYGACIFAVFFLTVWCQALLGAGFGSEKNIAHILIVNCNNPGNRFSDNIISGFKNHLTESKIDYRLNWEYLDNKGYDSPAIFSSFEKLFLLKYADNKPDVLVASGKKSLKFLLKIRDDVFPGIPIVFCGFHDLDGINVESQRNLAGVLNRIAIKENILLANNLFPAAKKFILVTDSCKRAKIDKEIFEQTVKDLKLNKSCVEFCDLPPGKLEQTLKLQTPRTPVFFISYDDTTYHTIISPERRKRIAEASGLPCFSFIACDIREGGFLGGSALQGKAIGQRTAGLVLEAIRGKFKTDKIKIVYESEVSFFNCPIVKKFGFEREDLPKDAIIVNRPCSMYSQYKEEIFCFLGGLIFLTIIVVMLSIILIHRRRAEKEILKAETKLHEAQKLAKLGDWEVNDLGENKVLWGEELYKVFGLNSVGELKDYDLREHIHPEDLTAYDDSVKQLLEKGELETEFRIFVNDALKWLWVHGKVFYDENGQALKAMGTIQDITQRKETEIALKDSEENLRITLQSIGDAVIATDSRGKITRMNQVAEKLTGWILEEAKGKNFDDIFRIFNSTSGMAANNPVTQVLEEGKAIELTNNTTLIAKDGTQRKIADCGAPIFNCSNQVVGVVMVFRDVTEKLQLQEQLRQSSKMDSLGQLTGGIAHDFNNMLGGILGYGQLLAAKLSDEKLKLYAERIVETSKRATDLTSKLLTFSRKGRKISTPVDIHSCIGDATEILERSIDKKITIEKQLKADNSIIMGDPALFQNIILNLGMNSRDSMPQGGLISITTENILLNKELCSQNSFNLMPGCYIKITVEDNGAGIDEKHLEHVFEPFFTTKQQRKGTGLGLATVYGAVREHNGSITVESELNKGTKFEILLPVSSIQTSPEKKPDERIICGSGLILIIDDEEIIRSMTTELLEDLGYEVVSANNGNEGVRLFSEYRDKIDLVILDMVMPEMNGEECFRKIMKLNPQAKVIICSGYVNGANIDSLKNEGVIDFIKKPFNPGIFSHIIYEALKNKSAFPKEDA